MTRNEAILYVDAAFLTGCQMTCVGNCDCAKKAREALAALGVTDEEIEAAWREEESK